MTPEPANERDAELLVTLSRECQLADIAFEEIEAKVIARPGPEVAAFFASDELSANAEYSGSNLLVRLHLAIRAAGGKEALNRDDLLMRFRLSLLLVYRVPANLKLSSEVLGAFAFINACQTGWPYLRQAVFDLSGRCGLPGLLLQVRRLPRRRMPGKA